MKTQAIVKFTDHGSTWSKIIEDLEGNILEKVENITLSEENRNKEYFDDWETQIRLFPNFDIVKVERFI